MLVQRFYPSSFYPEYFKTDLLLGSEYEFPFSTGLDEALLGILDLRIQQVSFTSASECDTVAKQQLLEQLGFSLQGLTREQISLLFLSRLELLDHKGTLRALEILAKAHFISFIIFKGYPFKTERLDSHIGKKIRLSEEGHQSHWITLQLEFPSSPEIIATFKKNALNLIPESMSIFVANPQIKSNLETQVWSLNKDTILKPRRI